MVCAHMSSWGHRGVVSTMHELHPSCMWGSMEADEGDFVGECPRCVDSKAGGLKPPQLGGLIRGGGVNEVVHFDFFYIRAYWPLGKEALAAWRAMVFSHR